MKSIIKRWSQLFSSKKKILKILEEIRNLKDADRVLIYTLGNKTSVLNILHKVVLYEVTRDKSVKKTTDLYNERPLCEEDYKLIEKLISKGRLHVGIEDVSFESVERWKNLKISDREIQTLCLNKKGNYHIVIDNPNKDNNEEVLLNINNLKRFF